MLTGVGFPEAPRWHDGALYFSDLQQNQVLRWDPATDAAEVVAEVPGTPSGLGWDADGTLLVVSMFDGAVVRDGKPVATMTSLAAPPWNDMVVDASGRAYVGNVGYDFTRNETPRPTVLALVWPDGYAEVVAGDLQSPNGMVLHDDVLIVAETRGCRLTAFPVAADGTLGERREFANLGTGRPDGIAVDADGEVWVALLGSRQVLRIADGGAVTAIVSVSQPATACALSDDGATLYVTTAPGRSGDHVGELLGRIEPVAIGVSEPG